MSPPRPMRWYLGGVGCWFLATGVQATLFPWLVAVDLGEDAVRVGTAQTLAMLPVLLLMLAGGAFADRHDCRTLLVRLHALAVVPPLLLAAAIHCGAARYELIVGYAVAMGVIAAFAIPARESLLSRVAGRDLQRAVTVSIVLQTLMQVVGAAIGGAASSVGAAGVLIVQALANAVGALSCLRVAPAPSVPGPAQAGRRAEIRAGLRELVRTPRLLTVTLLSTAIGVLFLGPFLVALPLMVRDLYGGSAPEIAGINAGMLLGMMAGATGLLAIGGVRRHGRALLLSLALGAAVLLAIAAGPPLPLVYVCVFLFGAGGGIATPAGRTLVQEEAPPSHRARILSAYGLGFMGAAPFGAFATGALSKAYGPGIALAVPAATMLLVIVVTLFATNAWCYASRPPREVGPAA